jgi:hypothetical protein
MFVRIYDWGHGSYINYKNDLEIGLKYADHPHNGYRGILFYEVMDKRLFMLAIIKHGINYKEMLDIGRGNDNRTKDRIH